MLDRFPVDVLCVLLERNIERHSIANKLLQTSHSMIKLLENNHVCRLLLIDNTKCVRRSKRAKIAFGTSTYRHGKSLTFYASSGYTALFKLIVKQFAIPISNKAKNKLLRVALQNGAVGTVRYFSSLHNVSLPDSTVMIDYMRNGNSCAVKAAYSLGLRLNRAEICRKMADRLQVAGLHYYLEENLNMREISFPGWFDSNWEMRLAYYYGNHNVMQWLYEQYGLQPDSACMDMIMLSATDTMSPFKCLRYVELMHRTGWVADGITLHYGCLLGCIEPAFKSMMARSLPIDAVDVATHGQFVWDLMSVCILHDRLALFKVIFGYYHKLNGFSYISPVVLENAIAYGAESICAFLVHEKDVQCDKSDLLPHDWDTSKQNMWHVRTLLIAGVAFPNIDQMFVESLDFGKLYCFGGGILKSPLYAKRYITWMMENDHRSTLLLCLLRSGSMV